MLEYKLIFRIYILGLVLIASIVSCHEDINPKTQIILCIGQSNMAGRAEIPSTDTFPLGKVLLFNDKNQWEQARNPLNRYSSIRKAIHFQRLGPSWTFSKTLSSNYPDRVFGLVVNARGGTSIDEWGKGSFYYKEAISRVLDAKKTGEIIGIIWHQGESDRNKAKGYVLKFSNMIGNMRKDIGILNLPIVVGEIGEWKANSKLVNNEINRIPIEVAFSSVVSIDGLSFKRDSVHFDTQSQHELGLRYAKELIKLLELQ